MNILSILKTFFKSANSKEIPIAVRDTFSAARARYEESQKAIEPSATRAKRCGINLAASHGNTKASKIYDQESATYVARLRFGTVSFCRSFAD